MLCLSRRVGESMKVGDAIVTVLSNRGGHVRFGIVADPKIPVDRIEVWERKQAERDALGGGHGEIQ